MEAKAATLFVCVCGCWELNSGSVARSSATEPPPYLPTTLSHIHDKQFCLSCCCLVTFHSSEYVLRPSMEGNFLRLPQALVWAGLCSVAPTSGLRGRSSVPSGLGFLTYKMGSTESCLSRWPMGIPPPPGRKHLVFTTAPTSLSSIH